MRYKNKGETPDKNVTIKKKKIIIKREKNRNMLPYQYSVEHT